jgi:hypothetical protein
MKLLDIKKIAGIIAVFAGLSSGLFAQEKNDAINVFNQGVEFMKAHDPRSLETFEKCVAICDQIGDSAADIKAKAITVLPDLYFQPMICLPLIRKFPNQLKLQKSLYRLPRNTMMPM